MVSKFAREGLSCIVIVILYEVLDSNSLTLRKHVFEGFILLWALRFLSISISLKF